MENRNSNPLANYFRQPSIYLSLPSGGRWWTEGSITLSGNREISIFPMSTRDEIILRTPDALMNGQGVVDVIQSCCPEIKDAWKMPGVDTDAILIAIRIASYGPIMDFDSKCSHCGHDNKHGVDLGTVLSSVKCSDYAATTNYKDLKIKFKPMSYSVINKNNMSEYSEQKLINVLSNSDISAENKQNEISELIKRIHDLSIDTCANSTDYIELPNGDRINNKDYITEFYTKSSADLIKLMQSAITQFNEEARIPPYTVQCESCTNAYQVSVSFDYSNFFVNGS